MALCLSLPLSLLRSSLPFSLLPCSVSGVPSGSQSSCSYGVVTSRILSPPNQLNRNSLIRSVSHAMIAHIYLAIIGTCSSESLRSHNVAGLYFRYYWCRYQVTPSLFGTVLLHHHLMWRYGELSRIQPASPLRLVLKCET